MYPPTRQKVLNPLLATVGGIVVPVLVYHILMFIFESAGAFNDSPYTYEDTAKGWGLTTATDIYVGWATSLIVFGAGHPGVSYHILVAMIHDGITAAIIFIYYPHPHHPVKPEWLGLCIMARVLDRGAFVLFIPHDTCT